MTYMRTKQPGLLAMAVLLGCTLALASSPTLADKHRLDRDKPEDAIKLQQKFTCSLNEGETTYGMWQGSFYARIEGEQDKELFKVMGVNVRQCKNLQDEKRGPGFRSVSREIMLYLDPETGEVLDTWTNPYTGEELKVVHVANDPVNIVR